MNFDQFALVDGSTTDSYPSKLKSVKMLLWIRFCCVFSRHPDDFHDETNLVLQKKKMEKLVIK